MRPAARALGMLVGITGLIQIVLGVLFWTGHAHALVRVHIVIGLTLVLALWALAILAAQARISARLVVLAAVWGLIVAILGLTQTRLLPGGAHWVIQVLHLLVGLVAIGLAQILAAKIRQALPPERAREIAGLAP